MQSPELREVASRRAAHGRQQLVPREAVRACVMLQEIAHDVVERLRVVGGIADREIEQKSQQLALEIIGDRHALVDGRRIPGGRRRPFRSDHEMRGIALEILDRCREPAREVGG